MVVRMEWKQIKITPYRVNKWWASMKKRDKGIFKSYILLIYGKRVCSMHIMPKYM